MNCIIPFESKVKFDSNVKEICSISLEHEITQNDEEILGNFIVSGTCKEHELSVNTSDFKFTIPFSVELTHPIYPDTLEFAVDNFTYDHDGEDLTIMIDYVVSADDKEEERAEECDDPFELIEQTSNLETTENVEIKDDDKEGKEEKKEEIIEDECEEERESIDTSLVTGLKTSDDYTTYIVHTVAESETMESICIKYKTSKDDILKLNDVTQMVAGDKILVPKCDE